MDMLREEEPGFSRHLGTFCMLTTTDHAAVTRCSTVAGKCEGRKQKVLDGLLRRLGGVVNEH